MILSQWDIREFPSVAKMKAALNLRTRGVTTSGLLGSTGLRLKPALRNQPQFEELAGPMWGGYEDGKAVVRYESPEVFRELST